MNRIRLIRAVGLFLLVLLMPIKLVWADAVLSPLAYLNAMSSAHKRLNYEQLYLFQQGESSTSLRYRHAFSRGKSYAQLLRLDHAREEIILRDDMVSYFGDFQPFSLPSSAILDDLPAVLQTDFTQLEGYAFVDAGRRRVANRLARVIRILPQDEFRYQYELWIDEETHLLLKSDLLDRNRQVLEQFRVIQSLVDEQLNDIVDPINALILPTLIQPLPQKSLQLGWQPNWIPPGFRAVAVSQQTLSEMLLDEQERVESQLYSDGLFSFTIYLIQNKGLIFNEQFLRQGKTSIYSQTIGDKDVVVIGDIPLVSARHIVQEIQFLP